MVFSLGYSPWLLGLCVLVAGALTYWTYRRTIPSIGARWRALLGTLRFSALTLICLLLFQPVLERVQSSERPPVLGILVDDSESMRVVTAGANEPSRTAAQDATRPILQALTPSQIPGESQFFTFDQTLRGFQAPTTDSMRFEGARTDLATVLQAARDELQGENLRGVVLVSDGQYNTGRTPTRIADRYPVPIYTVTVGDTSRHRDLLIRRVATNDRAYLDSEVPVRVDLRMEEGQGNPVTVTLERNGEVLDATEEQMSEGTSETSVDLTYQPEEAGLHQLTVRASELPGETTTRNNSRTVSLRVLESKRRVLLLGAAPSPTFASIRRVFERDADTEVVSRVPNQDGSFQEGPLPEDLSQIDVLVSVGFPSEVVPDDPTRRAAALMEEGTPALFILDRQTDLEAWAENFDSFLPATTEATNTGFTEASFDVEDGAYEHPVFRIEDAELSLFDRLPPLQVSEASWTPTPDARVLATATRPGTSTADPLLVLRERAGHRTAMLLGTGLWRWALLPTDLETARPLLPGLTSNLLRWVATQDDDEPVRVEPVTSTFEGGEPVEFTGQVYDESMNPLSDASVEVTVTDSAGTEYPYSLDPRGNGQYSLEVGSLPEGSYRYEATASLNGTEIGTDQGQFSVGGLRLEYQATRADAVTMRQIASRSGGRSYTPEDVDRLPDDLASTSSFSAEVVEETSEAELWRTSLFLIVILGLLAVEWGLRKRLGLT